MNESNIAMVFVCQRGEIELKAALLAASLRARLGFENELVAVVPEVLGSRYIPSETTLNLLATLKVRIAHITNDVITNSNTPLKGDLLINKAYCLTVPVSSKKLVFLDSDILCLRPFDEEIFLNVAPFQAKPVDHQTYRIWEPIYDLFALDVPQADMAATVSGELGPPYFNSGLLVVDSSVASNLAETWVHTFSTITESGAMNQKPFYREQVSLAVALQRDALIFDVLSETFNYPAHLQRINLNNIPTFVHYHRPDVVLNEKHLLREVRSLVCRHPSVLTLINSHKDWLEIGNACK